MKVDALLEFLSETSVGDSARVLIEALGFIHQISVREGTPVEIETFRSNLRYAMLRTVMRDQCAWQKGAWLKQGDSILMIKNITFPETMPSPILHCTNAKGQVVRLNADDDTLAVADVTEIGG